MYLVAIFVLGGHGYVRFANSVDAEKALLGLGDRKLRMASVCSLYVVGIHIHVDIVKIVVYMVYIYKMIESAA